MRLLGKDSTSDIYPQIPGMSSSGVYISRPGLKEGNSRMHWVSMSLDFPGLLGIKHVSKDCLGTSKCTKHRCMSTRPSPQHIPAWPTQLPLECTLCKDCIPLFPNPGSRPQLTLLLSLYILGEFSDEAFGVYYLFISRATVFTRGTLGIAPERYTCVYMDTQVIGPAPLPSA